jgi:hypothetical protein
MWFSTCSARSGNAGIAFELGIEVGVDHPFLAGEALHRLLFAEPLDIASADDFPVALAGPTSRGEGLRIDIGDADFVDVLAQPDIRSPAAEFDATCDKKYRHRFSPSDSRCAEE